MSFHVLAAVRREQVRVQVVLEAAAADPAVPDSTTAIIKTAWEDLRDAGDELRKALDREAAKP